MTPFTRTGYTPIEHEPRTAADGGSNARAALRPTVYTDFSVLAARRLFCIYQSIYLLVLFSV